MKDAEAPMPHTDAHTAMPVELADALTTAIELTRANVLADLYAQVEAMRQSVRIVPGIERPSASEGAAAAYGRVLDAIDAIGQR